MRKNLFLLFLTLLTTLVAVNNSYAQDNNDSKKEQREQRKQERLQSEAAQVEHIKLLLDSKDFAFQATKLSSSGRAAISNIRLNSLWYIRVTPNSLDCYLPIYGTATPVSQPSIMSRMDVKSNNFTYELRPPEGRRKTYEVEIVTKDNRSNSEYTILLFIPENGSNVRLNVSSTFNAPVTFDGYIID